MPSPRGRWWIRTRRVWRNVVRRHNCVSPKTPSPADSELLGLAGPVEPLVRKTGRTFDQFLHGANADETTGSSMRSFTIHSTSAASNTNTISLWVRYAPCGGSRSSSGSKGGPCSSNDSASRAHPRSDGRRSPCGPSVPPWSRVALSVPPGPRGTGIGDDREPRYGFSAGLCSKMTSTLRCS